MGLFDGFKSGSTLLKKARTSSYEMGSKGNLSKREVRRAGSLLDSSDEVERRKAARALSIQTKHDDPESVSRIVDDLARLAEEGSGAPDRTP